MVGKTSNCAEAQRSALTSATLTLRLTHLHAFAYHPDRKMTSLQGLYTDRTSAQMGKGFPNGSHGKCALVRRSCNRHQFYITS